MSGAVATAAAASDPPAVGKDVSKLLVVWTSGDRDVALKMVFMYTYNAKKSGWFDEVQLLVWGPSSKLLSHDRELQESFVKMKETGVTLTACKACAEMYGVADALAGLGIEVRYMGQPLSDMLKGDWKVITF
ncbi:MAG: DsrE family protein [Acidobacteria bacterium]|nr:DsrE family protein [Acidobacteriota bacterium]